MSQLGQQLRSKPAQVWSGLPPKADINPYFGSGPISDVPKIAMIFAGDSWGFGKSIKDGNTESIQRPSTRKVSGVDCKWLSVDQSVLILR
jgi:hypothetical protein